MLGALALLIVAAVGLRGAPWYGPHAFGGWMWGTGWLLGPVLWAGLIGLAILLVQEGMTEQGRSGREQFVLGRVVRE